MKKQSKVVQDKKNLSNETSEQQMYETYTQIIELNSEIVEYNKNLMEYNEKIIRGLQENRQIMKSNKEKLE